MPGFSMVRVPERAEAGIASAAGVGTFVERGRSRYGPGEAGWFGFGSRASSTIQGGYVPKGDVRWRSFWPEFNPRFSPTQFPDCVSR
jgi:hypothetical protein